MLANGPGGSSEKFNRQIHHLCGWTVSCPEAKILRSRCHYAQGCSNLTVPDRSSAVLAVLKIGREVSRRGRGISMRDVLALAQAQYAALRRSITPYELLPILKIDSSLVEDWIAYSQDKRTDGGFYVLRPGEVGEVGDPRARRTFPSIEEAIAEFVLQELDYWQSLAISRPK